MKKEDLWNFKGVKFVGTGFRRRNGRLVRGEMCRVIGVERKKSLSELANYELIPSEVEGVPTDVRQVGVLRAYDVNTGFKRPCPGGYSVGNERITAGTLGCWLKWDDRKWIMSNNHVLGASNEGARNDRILQPGKYDGGTIPISTETVKVLINFGDEAPGGCMLGGLFGRRVTGDDRTQGNPNVVDLALSVALDDSVVDATIAEIGTPGPFADAQIGTVVMRNGRTLGYVRDGLIEAIGSSQVDYGGPIATFDDQFLISKDGAEFSAPGDSGSAILNQDNKTVCGLLFAGGEGVTVANRVAAHIGSFFEGAEVLRG